MSDGNGICAEACRGARGFWGGLRRNWRGGRGWGGSPCRGSRGRSGGSSGCRSKRYTALSPKRASFSGKTAAASPGLWKSDPLRSRLNGVETVPGTNAHPGFCSTWRVRQNASEGHWGGAWYECLWGIQDNVARSGEVGGWCPRACRVVVRFCCPESDWGWRGGWKC